MPDLFAQPYNLDATGFYFDCADQFNQKAADHRDSFDNLVEEYEIQFIDGDDVEYQLFDAFAVDQANLQRYFNAVTNLDEQDKIALIAMSECGYDVDDETDTQDVELHYADSFRTLAMQFVDEGMYGEIPNAISHYIDYEAIARDLEIEHGQVQVGGQNIVYRCP